jgi:adenylate cyclase
MTANQSEAPWPALRRASRTVVVVDVVESVRLMEQDEDDTIRRWQSFVGEVVTRLLPQSGGRLVKSLGDGLMLEFESVPPAIQCALAMQQAIQPHNHGRTSERLMCLRIGAHVADVVVDERDIYGKGVNLAARLSSLAGPGEIVVSVEVRDRLVVGLDADVEDLGMEPKGSGLHTEDLGACHVKHIEGPVRAYRLWRSAQRHEELQPLRVASERELFPSLAVVPPAVTPDQPDATLMASLLGDELTATFSRSAKVNVVSRLSAVAFGERALADAGRYLGVDHVLSGRCVVYGDRLRFYAELSETATGHVIWADVLLVSCDELVSGRSDAILQVTEAAHNAITSRALQRTVTQPWPNLHSYELMLASITLMHRGSEDDFNRAYDLLGALVERAPRQASVYAWLAKWHVLRVSQGLAAERKDDTLRALDYSRRAMDLDPECSLAHIVTGSVQVNMLKRLDLAEASYARALQVDPNDSLGWLLKGTLHAFRGEGMQAVGHTQHALKLAPLHPIRYYYESLAATAALSAGHHADAVALAQSSLRHNRMHTSTWRALIIAEVQAGALESARAHMTLLRELEPKLTVRNYLERTASSGYSTGRLWASSLQEAGLPAG